MEQHLVVFKFSVTSHFCSLRSQLRCGPFTDEFSLIAAIVLSRGEWFRDWNLFIHKKTQKPHPLLAPLFLWCVFQVPTCNSAIYWSNPLFLWQPQLLFSCLFPDTLFCKATSSFRIAPPHHLFLECLFTHTERSLLSIWLYLLLIWLLVLYFGTEMGWQPNLLVYCYLLLHSHFYLLCTQFQQLPATVVPIPAMPTYLPQFCYVWLLTW